MHPLLKKSWIRPCKPLKETSLGVVLGFIQPLEQTILELTDKPIIPTVKLCLRCWHQMLFSVQFSFHGIVISLCQTLSNTFRDKTIGLLSSTPQIRICIFTTLRKTMSISFLSGNPPVHEWQPWRKRLRQHCQGWLDDNALVYYLKVMDKWKCKVFMLCMKWEY